MNENRDERPIGQVYSRHGTVSTITTGEQGYGKEVLDDELMSWIPLLPAVVCFVNCNYRFFLYSQCRSSDSFLIAVQYLDIEFVFASEFRLHLYQDAEDRSRMDGRAGQRNRRTD
ncbi:hypothetical protein DINM_000168 [Dirofilaria immitis]|nr:hypothetical protein [Dirofilaria immitis]